MSNFFKWHDQVAEVVPYNAQYQFPTQATRCEKYTVKLPPKGNSSYQSTQVMRFEFPADSYLNAAETCLSFTTRWDSSNPATDTIDKLQPRFQKNILSVVKRMRVLYGSMVLEDVQEHNCLVRMLTELTVPDAYAKTNGSITDGLAADGIQFGNQGFPSGNPGNFVNGVFSATAPSTGNSSNYAGSQLAIGTGLGDSDMLNAAFLPANAAYAIDMLKVSSARTYAESATTAATTDAATSFNGAVLTRGAAATNYDIQTESQTLRQFSVAYPYQNAAGGSSVNSSSQAAGTGGGQGAKVNATALGYNWNTSVGGSYKRQYCVRLLSGLLNQEKLIPLKWMSSQLAIELTLATEADCALWYPAPSGTTPKYTIDNINMICELLRFDSTYDQGFYQALNSKGIPLKFSSFHRYVFNLTGQIQVYQIHERSRSVKSLFAVIRNSAVSGQADSHNFFFNPSGTLSSPVTSYQLRVGGTYYPSQPVDCRGGAAEAFIEVQKALNTYGNCEQSSGIKYFDWSTSHTPSVGARYADSQSATQQISTYYKQLVNQAQAPPVPVGTQGSQSTSNNYAAAPNNPNYFPYAPGRKFVIGCEFEATDGFEMSGLNAEEVSDIALSITFDGVPDTQIIPFVQNPAVNNSVTLESGTYSASTEAVNQGFGPFQVDVFVHYDSLMIIRPNSIVDLVS